ncbi:MAG: hypothetical protein HYZ25_12710 [Chloroflexi bacterium]|nr:hypothetical protein [Chloroflexota bacterium]
MHIGQGQLFELYYDDGRAAARILCSPLLVPAPGQYLLAHDGSDAPLAVPVFQAGPAADGFLAASPLPRAWTPGTALHLRGPLGRGFSLPATVRRLALLAWDDMPARLLALLPSALRLGAAVTLVCESAPRDLSAEVEVQPMKALDEVLAWADFLAVDAERESLPGLKERLGGRNQLSVEAQVLVRTAMPCGALAECGVCAVRVRNGWRMACKDGPVFDWNELKE